MEYINNVLTVISFRFAMSTTDKDSSVLSQILEKLSSIELVLGDHTEKLTNIQLAVDDHGKRIGELEKSMEHHSSAVDDPQKEIETLKKALVDQRKDFQLLKTAADNTQNELKQEKLERNRQDQYFRSSFFVQLHGVALQPGEDKADDKEATNSQTLDVMEEGCISLQLLWL